MIKAALQGACGAVFGAGVASLAAAATPAAAPELGPPALVVLGVEVPLFSALFGVMGVVLARMVAPATEAGAKLGRIGNVALTALLALGVLALIVSGQKQPLVATAWAVGLGYTGLAFIDFVARTVTGGAKLFLEAFVRASIAAGSAWAGRKEKDGDA